ncbi:unnamed protein product [Schistosoma curassoni]|uniref:Robl_LC7 domain-containing protein n=1 Tax=Schistosoma curassoni TaxID=6186 RepID=A0A183K6P1_9TREM|nr:unnamed protein product [Schistosoma curassoni]
MGAEYTSKNALKYNNSNNSNNNKIPELDNELTMLKKSCVNHLENNNNYACFVVKKDGLKLNMNACDRMDDEYVNVWEEVWDTVDRFQVRVGLVMLFDDFRNVCISFIGRDKLINDKIGKELKIIEIVYLSVLRLSIILEEFELPASY